MAKSIPTAERLSRARALIQQAREVPVPAQAEGGKHNFSYIAQVKALLQDARDLVKFLPQTAAVTEETKEQVKLIFAEAEAADREILRYS
jgi:hypothetical protein